MHVNVKATINAIAATDARVAADAEDVLKRAATELREDLGGIFEAADCIVAQRGCDPTGNIFRFTRSDTSPRYDVGSNCLVARIFEAVFDGCNPSKSFGLTITMSGKTIERHWTGDATAIVPDLSTVGDETFKIEDAFLQWLATARLCWPPGIEAVG